MIKSLSEKDFDWYNFCVEVHSTDKMPENIAQLFWGLRNNEPSDWVNDDSFKDTQVDFEEYYKWKCKQLNIKPVSLTLGTYFLIIGWIENDKTV